MPYAELHCHSAFSFLDGASHPQELAGEAVAQGHTALALTDHDGLHGAMEMAQALKRTPVRHITGAEMSVEDGSHLTLLCETAPGLSQPVPADHGGARGHAVVGRSPSRCAPITSYESLERHAAGLVCLSGCARHGAVARDDRGGAPRRGCRRGPAAAAHLRARPLADRDPAPLRPPRPPPQPAAVPAGRAAGGARRGHRQRARPLTRTHAAAGRGPAPGGWARRGRSRSVRVRTASPSTWPACRWRRCARTGWSRIAGGRVARFAGATSSWCWATAVT